MNISNLKTNQKQIVYLAVKDKASFTNQLHSILTSAIWQKFSKELLCVHCVMTLRQQRQFWSCKKAGPIPSLVCTLRSFELANRTNRGNSLLLPLVSFGLHSFYLWRGLKNNLDFYIRSKIKKGNLFNHQIQCLTEGFWTNLLEPNF